MGGGLEIDGVTDRVSTKTRPEKRVQKGVWPKGSRIVLYHAEKRRAVSASWPLKRGGKEKKKEGCSRVGEKR